MGLPEGEDREKETEEILGVIMTDQINIRHQATELGKSENTKKYKYQKQQNKTKKRTPGHNSHIKENQRQKNLERKHWGEIFINKDTVELNATAFNWHL